jgi:hypothetical protein
MSCGEQPSHSRSLAPVSVVGGSGVAAEALEPACQRRQEGLTSLLMVARVAQPAAESLRHCHRGALQSCAADVQHGWMGGHWVATRANAHHCAEQRGHASGVSSPPSVCIVE